MNDPVEKSDAYDEKLKEAGIHSVVDALSRHLRRQGKIQKAVVLSLTIDVILSVAIGILALRAEQAATKANKAQDIAAVTCITSNQARATEKTLWDFVLNLPPNADQTPTEKKEVEQFKELLANTLAPRPC